MRRDLTTGEEVRLAGSDDPLRFVSDVSWTADGEQLAFTVGEINTGVYVIDADTASMDAARRLGPGQEQAATDLSWSDTAAFGQRLAVTETCCDVGEARWRVIDVDPGDASLHGTLMGTERLEAVHLDSNADASALLAIEGGGLEGGTLRRWNGAGEAHTVADDLVAAAW